MTNGEVKIVDEFTGRVLEGPPLLRGTAPGDRGEGGRSDQGGEPDPRDDHDPELLQDVREARRHDRNREDPARPSSRRPTSSASSRSRRTAPMIRDDEQDLIYKGEDAKWNAVVDDIVERHERGQPILVGTVSIEKSETLVGLPQPPRHPASRPEREEPREGGDDRRPGRPPGLGHGRDEHGRPRRRHPARRQPRVPRATGDGGARLRQRPLPAVRDGRGGARRVRGRVRADLSEVQGADPTPSTRRSSRSAGSVRPRHRATRVPPHRQPAPRPVRPPGRPGRVAVLPLARGRPHADVRERPRGLDHGAPEVARRRADHREDGHQAPSRTRSARSRSSTSSGARTS